MSDLIDIATLEGLVDIDESAMPSTCTVQYQTTVSTPTGGTKPSGVWANRNATPMKCRIAPPQTVRNVMTGVQLQTVGDVLIQIALTAIKAQNVTVAADDEITTTTTVRLPGNDLVVSDRYKVVGPPVVGPYSTNLSVPCVKVS